MASQRNSDHKTPAVRSNTTLPSRLLEYFRRALMIVVIGALAYVAYGIGNLLSEWRNSVRPIQPSARTNTLLDASPLNSALTLSGSWTFSNVDWNMRSGIIDAKDVETRLKTLAEPPTGETTHYPDVSPEILRAIEFFHTVPVEHGDFLVYNCLRGELKAQLLARKVDGKLKAITMAVALPQSDGKFQIFELTPSGASSKNGESSHLLPLPDKATRLGARFADDGRLLLELITLDSNADSLKADWNKAGWEVRPSGLGDLHSYSLLCGRGNDVIYAWSADPPEALKTLMLVRSPTDEELQAERTGPNK